MGGGGGYCCQQVSISQVQLCRQVVQVPGREGGIKGWQHQLPRPAVPDADQVPRMSPTAQGAGKQSGGAGAARW